jgi:hypothetical protein
MINQTKKSKSKPKKEFFFSPWGYKRQQFQKWGKEGGQGQPIKYVSNAEKQKSYRRRKAKAKIYENKQGILNMTTGRISKYRTNAERQRAYRLRKKAKESK